MSTTDQQNIISSINSIIAEEKIALLNKINDKILQRVDMRSTVMYEKTGDELRRHMTGYRFDRAIETLRMLYRKNNEAFEIVGMISEEITRALDEKYNNK